MLPSVTCCYQDKDLPFFRLSTLIWLILFTLQRGNKTLMASLSPQIRSTCQCVHMWGGLRSWGLQSSRSYGALLCTAWGHKHVIMAANSKQEVSVESPEMEWFVEASSSRHFSVLAVPELNVSVITTKAQKKPLFFKMQTKATLGSMHNNVWIS